jgi:Transmembrane protein 43
MTETGVAEEELAKAASNNDIEKGSMTDGALEGESGNRDITEVTSQSYGSKVSNSCTGACFGFFLFFASIALLIWNEGRTVKRQKDIDEGRETVIELDLNNFTNTSIPTSFENQLVHAVGDLGTSDVLMDPIFGMSNVDHNITANTTKLTTENILKLMRSVEMYQWEESSSTTSHKRLDGSTYQETTYSYSKVWSSVVIDSSQFREKSTSRANPGSLPFEPETLNADSIFLGNKLELEDVVVGALNWYEPYDTISVDTVPDATLRSQLSIYTSNGFFYRSNFTSDSSNSSPNIPSVGDARITFDVVLPDTVSIIAKLTPASTSGGSNGVDSYTTKRGGSFFLIERGVYTAEEMFTQAENDNTTTAWILRFVGFFIMVISILLILQPLATVVDIIPFVGDCIQSTMEGCLFPCIAMLIAIPTSLFVISLAWLAYRPNIAIPVAVGTLVIVIYLFARVRRSRLHQHQTNGTAADNSFQPQKPQEFNNNNSDVTLNAPYSATAPPYNTQNHNVKYNTEAGAEKINDNNGFAEALDHPLPLWGSNDNPADIKQGNTAIEEDVVFK